MAHEIQKNDKFAEVRSGGKRAWHGLGDELRAGLTAVAAFDEVGLGWETELAPLQAIADQGKKIQLPGHFAHLRRDTNDVLGIVTDGYRPFENGDLAKLADSLVDEGHQVSVETCGSLYNGKRVYVLVKLPKTIKASRDDVLEQYILISNGHGGFAVLSAYPTSVRVVCANTLRWSERSVVSGCSFRHSGDFDSKVKQARVVLGLASKETERFEEQVQFLVRTNLTARKCKAFMFKVYEQCFGKIDMEGDADTVEKLTKRRDKVMGQWIANLEDERNLITGSKGTAWGALNAVTQWHDHERGRYKTVHESGARIHSNLFGISQKHKLRTLQTALTLK